MMGKRLPTTPRSRVRAALRQLWLRSRERAAALKRDGYSCHDCGKKQSRAKGKEIYVEVHHIDGIKWEQLIDMVYEMLLCNPDGLITMCEDCHDKIKALGVKDDH
jgi:5-methylcytosine-specific restriction endonuclease McrA